MLLYSRWALEFALQWIFTADTSLDQPYKDDVNGMLNEPTFKRLAGERILDKMHVIRRIANKAVRTNVPVGVPASDGTLRELFQTCFWLAHRYSRAEEDRPQAGLQFDASLLSPQRRPMPVPGKPGEPKQHQPADAVPKSAEQVATLAKQLEERDRKLTEAAQQKAFVNHPV